MIYSFLYVIISSFGTVFIEKLYSHITPFFSLIITASIATIFFNIINIGKLKATYLACLQEKKLCLAIMFTILVMWSVSMIGPGLIGASFFLFIYFSCLGMLGFLSLSIIDWKKNHSRIYFFFSLLILVAVSLWDFFNSSSGKSAMIGVALSLIGGTSSFVYFKQSQLLIKRVSMSATQILAIRFYLTILIMFVILPKGSFATYFNVTNILQLVVLAIASIIAPLYFMQKALEKISTERHSIILSLSPIAAGLLQELLFQNVEIKFIIIYFIYFIIIVASHFKKSIIKREKK